MRRVNGYTLHKIDGNTGETLSVIEVTYEEVQALPCPACGVPAGELCRCSIGRGHTRAMWKQHVERRSAAFTAKMKD